MVYADFMASTPMCEPAVAAYTTCAHEHFANPSGMGDASIRAAVQLERLQEWFCHMFACDHVIWTSGATEANNLVIRTFGQGEKCNDSSHMSVGLNGGKVIGGETEHASVVNAMDQVGSIRVKYGDSIVDKAVDLVGYLREPVLATLMYVNNETGELNHEELLRLCELGRQHPDLYIHTDAAQVAGKSMPIKLDKLGIDYMTISGHKMHGPKGIGALLVKDDTAMKMLSRYSFGGNQQKLISGTINLPAIAAMKAAYKASTVAHINLQSDSICTPYLSCVEWNYALTSHLHGHFGDRFFLIKPKASVSWCLAFSIIGSNSDDVVLECKSTISNGSACKGVVTTSHVYRALGLSDEITNGILRVSYSPLTYPDPIAHATELAEDIIRAVEVI